jgi:hypothetical protein
MSEIPEHLLAAIAEGNLPKLRKWLDDGGDLWVRAGNNETLLHKACYNGKTEIAEFLHARGLPFTVMDDGGFMPVHEAARGGKAETLRRLLELGADPDAKLNNGKTADDLAGELSNAAAMLQVLRRARLKPKWTKTGEHEISHVSYRNEIDYRLTEIFNFRARSYVLITHNISTCSEAAVMKTFSDFGDHQTLDEAREELLKAGGTLPEEFTPLDKPKLPLTGRRLA